MVMKKFMATVFASMTALSVMPVTSVSAATTSVTATSSSVCMGVGENVKISASAGATFSSSNTNVATVASDGTVKAIGKGTVTIKSTVSGATKSYTVTVKNAPTAIKVGSTGEMRNNILGYNETISGITFNDGTNAASYGYTFTSSNPSAVSVNKSGSTLTLKGSMKGGSAVIKATSYNGKSVSFTVNCNRAARSHGIIGTQCIVAGRVDTSSWTTNKNTSAATSVTMYASDDVNSSTVMKSGGKTVTIPNGTKFTIEGVSSKCDAYGNYRFKVTYKGITGWVKTNYAMINFGQYIPSVTVALSFNSATAGAPKYKNSVQSASSKSNMFNYNNKSISGVSDVKRYGTNTAWLRWDSAKKFASAQTKFLKQGLSLKLYDAYRPSSTTKAIYNAWYKYIDKNKLESTLIWQIGSQQFVSMHNLGAAIDTTLVDINTNKELAMPTAMQDLSWNSAWARVKNGKSYGWKKNVTNGQFSKKGTEAKDRANNAYAMNSVFASSGLGTYDGEWWHFQDDSLKIGNSSLSSKAVIYNIDGSKI